MPTAKPLLSILIPTVVNRSLLLARLMDCLEPQLIAPVEVLTETDNGEASIGEKRNRLVNRAKGKWIVAIDDDDLVASDYITSILTALKYDPDCVGFWGQRFLEGVKAERMIYSMRMRYCIQYINGEKVRVRTPTHLCPMRATIVRDTPFKHISYGEDTDFAQRVWSKLRTENFIDKTLYLYYFRNKEAPPHVSLTHEV